MPFLALPPPPPQSSPHTATTVSTILTSGIPTIQIAHETTQNHATHTPVITSKVPCVTLDSDVITDEMAARLAVSLLGHVMFLKSQVPFPVMQLANMPGGQSDTRASRKRTDLLASFDTLASHLQTTFTALSTALARKRHHQQALNLTHAKQDEGGVNRKKERELARAFLAIVVGPSAGSARARVVFAVDGLEVRLWGERDDVCPLTVDKAAGTTDEDTEEVRESDEEDEVEESGDESESGKEASGSDSGDAETDSGSDLGLDSSFDSVLQSEEESDSEASFADSIIDDDPPLSSSPPPPPSRSPSPTNSPNITPPSSPIPSATPLPPPLCSDTSPPVASSGPQPQSPTYASSQAALRTAERLLSRTLASACAEEGGGMSAELAPTQTHILLRAPRRFVHPAWTPKQSVARAMDGVILDFLRDSGLREENGAEKILKRKGAKVEGVWVRCRGGQAVTIQNTKDHDKGVDVDENEEGDEDELIWWTWDGKLVGFSDW